MEVMDLEDDNFWINDENLDPPKIEVREPVVIVPESEPVPVVRNIFETEEAQEFVSCVCEFLSVRDLLNLRRLNSFCNRIVNNHPSLGIKCRGVFRTKWYSQALEINPANAICWKEIILRRFAYFRSSQLFRQYWTKAASNVTHLTIWKSSLECFGLANLLNYLPKLNTLNLDGVNLRDVDNYHDVIIPGNGDVEPSRCFGPFEQPLKHLIIQNSCRIEGCFFEHLKTRTGQLESLTVKNCFKAGQHEAPVVTDILSKRIYEFQFYILELLKHNTILTKFVCENDELFTARILEVSKGFYLTTLRDLSLSFPDEKLRSFLGTILPVKMTDALNFLKVKGKQLTHLKLTFLGKVTKEQLTGLLEPSKDSLVSLKIVIGNSDECRTEEIQIPCINEMPKLEILEISDTKKRLPKDVHKYWNARTTDEQKAELVKKLKSSINTAAILPDLPTGLTELKISGLVSEIDMYAGLPEESQEKFVTAVRYLTRLEIRGPWLTNVGPLLEMLFTEAKSLESLTLSNCAINDVHLTGLDKPVLREFLQSQAHFLDLITQADQADAADVPASTTRVNLEWFRPFFSSFQGLKYLDLSHNEGITDLSFLRSVVIPNLETLNIAGCDITDKGLDLISQQMKKLKYLNVKFCYRTSLFGLNRVISGCPKMRRLYCSKRQNPNNEGNFEEMYRMHWNPNFHDIIRHKITGDDSGCEDDEIGEGNEA